MSLKKNDIAAGFKSTPIAGGSELIPLPMTYSLDGDLAANDIIHMGYLPADHVPEDLIATFDALGGTGTLSFGILNAGLTDIDTSLSGGSAWLTAGSVASAGALRADAAGLLAMRKLVADSDEDLPIGLKVVADTSATSGDIDVTLMVRAAG